MHWYSWYCEVISWNYRCRYRWRNGVLLEQCSEELDRSRAWFERYVESRLRTMEKVGPGERSWVRTWRRSGRSWRLVLR